MTIRIALLLALGTAGGTQESKGQSFDERIEAELKKAGVRPAPLCDDADFLRRVSLDLAGVIPTPEEVVAFLDDRNSQKRSKKIDQLLAGAEFADHWARIWMVFLIGTPLGDADLGRAWFLEYLRDSLARNQRYDRVVREILAAEGNLDENKAAVYLYRWQDAADQTSAAVRHFLGVQLRCAQCHDHPFDSWTQRDFWATAAFFARATRGYSEEEIVMEPTYGFEIGRLSLTEAEEGEVDLPESRHAMKLPPRFLGEKTDTNPKHRRKALADWMTSPKNPWFAKATVNRIWGILLGRGFVHPVDDFGTSKTPVYPEALNRLAEEFVRSGFDLRALIRRVLNSRTYQRASRPADSKHPFAAAERRRMSRHQYFTSVARAGDFDFTFPVEIEERDPAMGPATEMKDFKEDYLYQIQRANSPVEKTLLRMNGSLVIDAIVSGKRLPKTLETCDTNEKRIEWLFLASLSRRPTVGERDVFLDYLDGKEEYPAYEDILWTLLNSTEFGVNR